MFGKNVRKISGYGKLTERKSYWYYIEDFSTVYYIKPKSSKFLDRPDSAFPGLTTRQVYN